MDRQTGGRNCYIAIAASKAVAPLQSTDAGSLRYDRNMQPAGRSSAIVDDYACRLQPAEYDRRRSYAGIQRKQWQTVNKLVHRKSSSPLPTTSFGTVVRRTGAPYRRVRIPGLSDLRVCVLSANKVIVPRTRCFHLMIQQAVH